MFDIISLIKKLLKVPLLAYDKHHSGLDYWPTSKENQMNYAYYSEASRHEGLQKH